jgi:two-component system, chemotaxis family, chemotaxis protein CheY
MEQPIRMLVADDSKIVQRLFLDAAAHSQLPLRITTTDNGRDCLTMLQGHDVDLAFIDVNMPDLSGTEAFWTARKLGVQTFVTLMSSPPSPKAVEMARKLNAYEFLFKPFKADDAIAIIKTYARITAPTKVLIVDDSQTVRQIIQKTIKASLFNCRIADAADGQTAIERCSREAFDVVFLDCNMPNLSGLETLERLLKANPNLKVVMISSERDDVRDMRARKLGAYAFLPKPFTAADMDLTLHNIHGLRSPNLRLQRDERDFAVAIEGSTIRLVHNDSGHVFEYLWFKDAPHLRNGTVRAGATGTAAHAELAAIAECAAINQLNSARLVAAA